MKPSMTGASLRLITNAAFQFMVTECWLGSPKGNAFRFRIKAPVAATRRKNVEIKMRHGVAMDLVIQLHSCRYDGDRTGGVADIPHQGCAVDFGEFMKRDQ